MRYVMGGSNFTILNEVSCADPLQGVVGVEG
jgi:hypothetical protein